MEDSRWGEIAVRSFLYVKPWRAVPAEDWARWLAGVPSSPELWDCVMPSHSAPAQLLRHSVQRGSREGPSHGKREGGRGHPPPPTGSPGSLFCLTFLTKGSPARTWAWPQRAKFWRRWLYNLGRWGYSEGVQTTRGWLGHWGGHEEEQIGVTHSVVSPCSSRLWVTDGLSDWFIRTNGPLCCPPTEHAGCRFQWELLETLPFKSNMILMGNSQVPWTNW